LRLKGLAQDAPGAGDLLGAVDPAARHVPRAPESGEQVGNQDRVAEPAKE
jgi:hypothetical protein